MRSSDTVARIGPDEFALLMPDMADPENVLRLGRQLLALTDTQLRGFTTAQIAAIGSDDNEVILFDDAGAHPLRRAPKPVVARIR